MQFGVGLLGRDYDPQKVLERMLDPQTPIRDGWTADRAEAYAAKVAAESIFSEPPLEPLLDDNWIVFQCLHCARPVRIAEAPAIREAFLHMYGQQAFELEAA